MKSNKILIIVLIVIIAVAGYYFISSSSSTIKKELRDFAVKDTSAVTKIFMVDKYNSQILLERKGNHWMVNNSFVARQDAINLLLKTMNRIRVKSPVPKAAKENIIKRLASKSVKVEIYSGEELLKTYYVGDATQVHTGTYMLLENSASPFIMHIDGFNGFLSTRYFVDEHLWRTSVLFSYNVNEIKSVSINYPKNPEYSFKAINLGNNTYSLQNIEGKNIEKFDTIMVKTFISLFKNVHYETPLNNMRSSKIDSIRNQEIIQTFTVENKKGEKNAISTYNVLLKDTTFYTDGTFSNFDPDRMYTFINGDKNLVSIQYFIFDPMIRKLDDFIKK